MLKRVAMLTISALVIALVALFPASAAEATPVSGGTLTSGTTVSGSVSTSDGIAYTFTAVQGQHLTLAITAPQTSARLAMNVYNSSGAADTSQAVFSTSPTEIDFTPSKNQVGATSVVLSPYDSGATGTFHLTYAVDVTGSLTSGKAVPTTLSYAGQRTAYTFTAVAGKHVTLAITAPKTAPTGNRLAMNLYNSSGAADTGQAVFSTSATEIDFTPSKNQAGTTTVVISDYDFETTGSFTLTYATDVTGALTSGTPVSGKLSYAGQRTAYTFTAVAGKHLTLAITAPSIAPAGNRLAMNVYNSSGAADTGQAVFSTSPTEIDFTPSKSQAGTTTVVISDYDFETTGSFTLTYATDVTAALTSGTAVTGTLKYSGQHAVYTFTAVAGAHVTLAITSPSIPSGRLQMNVYDSSGALDAGAAVFSTTPTELDFTPYDDEAGPTTVVISPYDTGTTGTFTLTYATDLTGALSSGVAKTFSLTSAGQATAYTFTAVAGTPVTLAITSPGTSPAGNRLAMNVYDASGAADAGQAVFNTSPTSISFTPTADEAGTTTVVISDYDFETTGSATPTYTAG